MPMFDELRTRSRERFVGRSAELDRFDAALRSASSRVFWVFGPGGIGKTSSMDAFAVASTKRDRPVVHIDLRSADSAREALRAALSVWIEAGASATPPAVFIDSFERSDAVDRWMREELLSRLSQGSIVVIAGRQPPSLAWRSDPLWSTSLELMPLRALSVPDASALLDRLEVASVDHPAAIRLTGGHPLALSLLAQLLATSDRPGIPVDLVAAPDLVAGLLERLVGDVPSASHRRALELLALARVTNRSLLRSVIGDDAEAMFTWLEEQPYVDRVDDGLCPHDLVRDVLEVDLRRDPDRYAEANRTIRSFLLDPERLRRAPDPCLKDFIYLHRTSSLLSGYWDWATFDSAQATPPLEGDDETLAAIASSHDGLAAAECLRYWLGRRPETFTVVRSTAGEIQGVICLLTLAAADPDDLAADPVIAAVWAHTARARPLRPGEVIGVNRFFEDTTAGQAPSSTFNVLTYRDTRHWLLTEGLTLDYIVVRDRDLWEPVMSYIDFHPVPHIELTVGGTRHHLFVHDWREVTPARWLDRMEVLELGGPVPARSTAPPVLVALSEDDYAAAVRAALRDLSKPSRLADNPLTRSRVAQHLDGAVGAAAIERTVRAAFDALADDPRTDRARAALARTYLHGAVSQEAAAEVLGMAFSTYRRHLAAGIDLLVEQLWRWELYGRDG